MMMRCDAAAGRAQPGNATKYLPVPTDLPGAAAQTGDAIPWRAKWIWATQTARMDSAWWAFRSQCRAKKDPADEFSNAHGRADIASTKRASAIQEAASYHIDGHAEIDKTTRRGEHDPVYILFESQYRTTTPMGRCSDVPDWIALVLR